MDYTVIGDAVNVAARLQDLALAGEVLISGSAFALLHVQPAAEAMPRTKLRGRQQPLDVYRLKLS
jgi:class 3 adenylate cyclase